MSVQSTRRLLPAALVALAACPAGALAGTINVSFNQPTFDRWNYPFNFTPGFRTTASTFRTPFIPGQFDDRDAQFLNSFATGANVTPGLGAANYLITSARVTVTNVLANDGVVTYDPTFDAVQTYLEPFQGGFTPDTDAGRPIELFGTGFANGFNAFAYGETGPFGFGDPTAEDVRNAFAVDTTGVNVSNNIRDQFEVTPFAIGQVEGLAAGDLVPGGSTFVFDLDISNPAIQAYLAQGLDAGIVSFTISSLQLAGQDGSGNFPVWYTKENPDAAASPVTFEFTVQIIPTPGAAGVLALAGLAALRRKR